MTRDRGVRKAFLVAAAVLAALLPAVVGSHPASASHAGGTLDVTPELTSVQVGTPVTLTAHIKSLVPVVAPVTVNFRFEGGPLGGASPQTCVVQALQTTCTVQLPGSAAGVTLVRAWLNGVDPDATEGRLSAQSDCIDDPNETPPATCQAGDQVTPGTVTAEPDDTDVVRVTWRAFGLDVAPDDQPRARGETATLTATAYNVAGQPAANIPVKFELFDGSVSDPGGGNTPNIPDRTCTTGTSGTCAITLSQAADGTDVLCAWTSSTPPTMQGKVSTTPICDNETLLDLGGNDGVPSPIDDQIDVVRVLWGNANPTTTLPTTVPGTTPAPPGTGYWLVASDGGIFNFGDAVFKGSTGATKLNQPIVAMAATPTGQGYWLVASDGGIFSFGDAAFKGSTGAIKLNQPIVGMAATPSGGGYWLVARDGGIFAFGNAAFKGSTGGTKLNQPIVAMAATPTGNGYWLVAADGGVFAFGDAAFKGSTGGIKLVKPIVAVAATKSGGGYWMAASDGGIFAFGDAPFKGSTGAMTLNKPVVGLSRSTAGAGYRLVASDGGIFVFGDATFKGSTGAMTLNKPIVGMSGF